MIIHYNCTILLHSHLPSLSPSFHEMILILVNLQAVSTFFAIALSTQQGCGLRQCDVYSILVRPDTPQLIVKQVMK